MVDLREMSQMIPQPSEINWQERHVKEVEVALGYMDRLLEISGQLNMTPHTGYRIVAAARWHDGTWSLGLNDERHKPFRHAEVAAIESRSADMPLTHVYLVGASSKGEIDGLKHAIPCENCTAAIRRIASTGTLITLFTQKIARMNGLRLGNPYRFKDIVDSYKTYETVPICKDQPLGSFLDEQTKVIPADKRLLLSLFDQLQRLLDDDFELYLTGSSTGRSGPKGLVASSLIGVPYGDMDLVLITPVTVKGLDKMVGKMYKAALEEQGVYDEVEVEEVIPYLSEQQLDGESNTENLHARLTYSYRDAFQESKLVFPRHYLKELGPSSIDVTFGNRLEDVMTPEYLRRGWYVRLH